MHTLSFIFFVFFIVAIIIIAAHLYFDDEELNKPFIALISITGIFFLVLSFICLYFVRNPIIINQYKKIEYRNPEGLKIKTEYECDSIFLSVDKCVVVKITKLPYEIIYHNDRVMIEYLNDKAK